MVESFLVQNKDNNLIEEEKIMEDFLNNNGNGSSIFQGKIREEDSSAEQKLNELKAAIEKLDRQDLLRRLECERQASSCIDETSSQAELHIAEDNEDYFNGEERVLGDFWNFFESLFNLFEVDVDDPKIHQMLKEKKEKNLIAAIMKFLRHKLKELIKKIFTSNLDLSWDKRLDKEIKELQEKLGSSGLSPEEEMAILERLEALRGLKLKLQFAVTGWIITMFAGVFGVELAAIVEASTEETAKAEDKKAEKTSLKEEATKEVHKDVEIKVDEREKPKVPVSLFEVLPGFVRPVVLNKSERDLLPKPMKELMPKEVIKEEIREVKEAKPKVEEKKEAKPEPKKEVCPPKPAEQKPVVSGIKFCSDIPECGSFQDRRSNADVNGGITLNNEKKNGSANCVESRLNGSVNKKSTIEQDDFDAKLAKKVANFKIGVWNGAENEGSVNDAQPPKGLTNDVKVEKCVEGQSVGKT